MGSLNTLRVDVKALLKLARQNGWIFQFFNAMSKGAYDPFSNPVTTQAFFESLPAEADYRELRPQLSGKALLDLIECLLGVDHRVGGLVFFGMARELFAPHIPADHPAQQPTEDLLTALMAYLLEEAPAERYIGEAFRYRSQYGTTSSSAGTDSVFELLFEAMPSNGLCCPVGEGRWHLSMHWNSFGYYLAGQRDEWRLLDDIDEALDDYELVEGDVAAGREATDNVRSKVLEQYREALLEGALENYDEALAALIDRVLPAAVACFTPTDAPSAAEKPFIPLEMLESLRQKRAANRLRRRPDSYCEDCRMETLSNPFVVDSKGPVAPPPSAGNQAPLPGAGTSPAP